MAQSVELLLDDVSDAAIRAQWDALAAAGLPSLARQAAPSHRPHVTLAARRSVDPAVESVLAHAVHALPLRVRIGALACFGRGSYVLVRVLAASTTLLELQAAVTAVLGPDPATEHHFGTGRWTPHITLARRLTADQVAAALTVLSGPAEHDGRAVGCRRWDGDARREWPLV